jgi:hypothetical protein
MRSARQTICWAVGILLGLAVPAGADWIASAYLGASSTGAADLTLERPAGGVPTRSTNVAFDSKSLQSPPYYGYRIAWTPARQGRFGVEGELIHLKVYARAASLTPPVERFSISHGLNLLLGNLLWRQPLWRRVRLTTRAGAGVAVPHGESRVGGLDQEQYEVSSAAVQLAAGPEVALARHAHAFIEYKVTTAAPAVSVAGGTIKGRYTSQHLATGLGVEW